MKHETLYVEDLIALIHKNLIDNEPCSNMDVHRIIDETAEKFIKGVNNGNDK